MAHKAVFPGSFNPLHHGHIDIIKRAAKLFDCLYVAVSHNIDKKTTVNITKRFQTVKTKIAKLKLTNVEVVLNEGLTITLLKQLKCKYLVRSIRNLKDINYEINMAQNNYLLANNIETIFFVASSKLKDISSTNQRELSRQKQLLTKSKRNPHA
ncbi:MAG: pantetheine-phosphate adenylyltransferase [Mycoplasmataceae bacterium]|jgi:pantetheine-phosphate adenylyltransferase|nr:pantetheine-phosphate adenylyltransferase [Mycoplasmataceae bacterium]